MLLISLCFTDNAHGASGAWMWLEHREPLVGAPDEPYWSWRIASDLRFASRAGGLSESFMRTGPMFFGADWYYLALHGVAMAQRRDNGRFGEEFRIELEPYFERQFGLMTTHSRNRFETRWRNGRFDARVRTRLGAEVRPRHEALGVYIWDEVIAELGPFSISQNRFSIGLTYRLDNARAIEMGYMLRNIFNAPDAVLEHIVLLSFHVDGVSLVPREEDVTD